MSLAVDPRAVESLLAFWADAGVDASEKTGDEVSHELVLQRLVEAQPRIVAAIETIIRALPADYEPRELIPASAVAAVLARGS